MGPLPGPAIFVAQCLYVLPIFDLHCDSLSHLVISALRRFLRMRTIQKDILETKYLAARLLLHCVRHNLVHNEQVLVKIVEVFDVSLTDIDKVMRLVDVNTDKSLDTARKFVEQFVSELIESKSYMTAVALLEHFSMHQFGDLPICQSGESFLLEMLQNKEFRAAERWATFVGKAMSRVLVQEYIKENLQKPAYAIIKKNNMHQEFPEVCQQCKEGKVNVLLLARNCQ